MSMFHLDWERSRPQPSVVVVVVVVVLVVVCYYYRLANVLQRHGGH